VGINAVITSSVLLLMVFAVDGSFFVYHPLLMVAGFAVLLPLGVACARFRRGSSTIKER